MRDRLILTEDSFNLKKIPEALGKLKAKEATGDVIPYLGHKDEDVRREAAVALGKIGDPFALDILQEVNRTLEEYQGDEHLKEEVQKAISIIKSQN